MDVYEQKLREDMLQKKKCVDCEKLEKAYRFGNRLFWAGFFIGIVGGSTVFGMIMLAMK